ncbi:unnamed protein product, partial [Nesidiocoris tenuis]
WRIWRAARSRCSSRTNIRYHLVDDMSGAWARSDGEVLSKAQFVITESAHIAWNDRCGME